MPRTEVTTEKQHQIKEIHDFLFFNLFVFYNDLVNQNSVEKEKKEADKKEQHLGMVFFNPDLNRYKSWTLKP